MAIDTIISPRLNYTHRSTKPRNTQGPAIRDRSRQEAKAGLAPTGAMQHTGAATPARWSTGVERWEGFEGERHSPPAQGAMKVMPLHRKGWGNCGLEPGNREELDRKLQPCDRRLKFGLLGFSKSTRLYRRVRNELFKSSVVQDQHCNQQKYCP